MDRNAVAQEIMALDFPETVTEEEAPSRFVGFDPQHLYAGRARLGLGLGIQQGADPLADVVRVAVETVDMAVGFQLDETQRHVLVIHGDEDAAAVGHASQEVLGGCRGGLQASTCRGL